MRANLHPTTRRLWLAIAHHVHTHHAPPTSGELARTLGCSVSVVHRHLRRLEDLGYLERRSYLQTTIRLFIWPPMRDGQIVGAEEVLHGQAER